MPARAGNFGLRLAASPESSKLAARSYFCIMRTCMANPLKQMPRKPREGGQKPKQVGPSMWVQLSAAFGVFLALSLGYSFVRQYISTQDEVVPLSQIAQDITAGTIV